MRNLKIIKKVGKFDSFSNDFFISVNVIDIIRCPRMIFLTFHIKLIYGYQKSNPCFVMQPNYFKVKAWFFLSLGTNSTLNYFLIWLRTNQMISLQRASIFALISKLYCFYFQSEDISRSNSSLKSGSFSFFIFINYSIISMYS